jgi:hypothetical protein
MKIINLIPSTRKGKRFEVILSNNKSYHFGLDGADTYIDGASKQKRDAFLARHLNNPLEKKLIQELIPSPALFATYLLWNKPSLEENIKILNKLLE